MGLEYDSVALTEENQQMGEHSEEVIINEEMSQYQRATVLLKQSIPVILCYVVSISTTFITQYFAGHLELEGDKTVIFAGVALATLFYNVTCRSLLIGLSSALDTLASQNNGAKNYKEVGIVLQRCLLILSVFCIPLIPVWLCSENIFEYLQIDPRVSKVIGGFMRVRVLALPMDIFSESYEKYLMALGEMSIPFYVSCIIAVFILISNIILTHMNHLQYESLAWVIVISEYLGTWFMYWFSCKSPAVMRTLQPLSWEAWRNWGEFIRLALPAVAMLCTEWWAFEILTIFASLVSVEAVAAQAAVMQVSTVAYMFPLGLSITVCSFVGNALGAKKKNLAVEVGKLSYLIIFGIEICVSTLILTAGGAFVRLFALDEEVRTICDSLLPYLACFTIVDGVVALSSGILRGCGRQLIGALVNVIGYYLIGLPVAWMLCFHTPLGIRGLMMGIALAVIIQAIVYVGIIIYYEEYTYQTITGNAEKAFVSNTTYSVLANAKEGDVEDQSFASDINVDDADLNDIDSFGVEMKKVRFATKASDASKEYSTLSSELDV